MGDSLDQASIIVSHLGGGADVLLYSIIFGGSNVELKTFKGRLLASSLIAGVALGAPAYAQEAETVDTVETVVEDTTARQETVTITGTRIQQSSNLVFTSPVTQISSEDITTQGVTRIEDLVAQLPQAFASQNSTVSNGASGTATVDLRNLGPSRTLVLIDGRRMGYGSPSDVAADLNQIPTQMVERVEVLTGGASAVYGSDAVAGVVNFIMKKDFEGFQIDAQYSFYQHNNDYDTNGNLREVIAGRAETNPSQFQIPEDNVMDGFGKEITMIMGVNAPDDRGNITAYASYRNNDPILQGDRDYSACSIGSANATGFTCGGSSTSFPGRINNTFFGFGGPNVDINGIIPDPVDFTIDQTTGQLRPFSGATDQYNFGPTNYYQRPDERYNLGAFGRYQINEYAEAYTQLMFTDYESVAQIAPSGNFFSTETLNCGNPLFTAEFAAAIGCTPAEIAANTSESIFFGRRNVEGGGRQDSLRFTSYRGVVGLRGDIPELSGWTYDLSAQYSQVTQARTYRNEFSINRLNRAINVVSDPDTGLPVCQSVLDGTDPNCVPYNIFNLGSVTQEALNYVQVPLIQTGTTTQQVITAAVTGDLGQYGFRSPAATDGLAIVLGAEYRRDSLQRIVDVSFSTGDGAGQGGATLPVQGSVSNIDVFTEFQLPLVQGKPGVELLSIDGAFRYSDYDTGIQASTWKLGAEYAPTSDLRIRGSYQQATRAPNVLELFTAQGLNLFDDDYDPCGLVPAGGTVGSQALCTATGVPAALYGSDALNSPAGQYNFQQGGNPNLDPEEAETFTVGIVFTPSFMSGFTASVDYYSIDITDRIDIVDPTITLDLCYGQNDQAACGRINRSPGGSLWVSNDGFVEGLNTNIGGQATSGVDLSAAYAFELASAGSLEFSVIGTYLLENETDPIGVAAEVFDCAGQYGLACNTPQPEWRHRARVQWSTNFGATFTGTWRYYGSVDLFRNTADRVDASFDAENYFDLAGSYQILDNTMLRFGVNNVLDNDPPLSASVGTTGNGNTYPQTYDSFGRYVFIGATLDF